MSDRICLTWSGDPATSASVTWRTKAEVDSGAAEIAVADASPNFVFTLERHEAMTESFELQSYGWNSHSVTFDRLEPDTIYAYRVGQARKVRESHDTVHDEWNARHSECWGAEAGRSAGHVLRSLPLPMNWFCHRARVRQRETNPAIW